MSTANFDSHVRVGRGFILAVGQGGYADCGFFHDSVLPVNSSGTANADSWQAQP